MSALHYAAQIGSYNIVETLLAAGADPDYVGQGGESSFMLKAEVVAQAGFYLAQEAQRNPFAQFDSPELKERMKDPKALERYRKTMRLLKKASTKNE